MSQTMHAGPPGLSVARRVVTIGAWGAIGVPAAWAAALLAGGLVLRWRDA